MFMEILLKALWNLTFKIQFFVDVSIVRKIIDNYH